MSDTEIPLEFIVLILEGELVEGSVCFYYYRSNTKCCTAANIVPDLHPQQLDSTNTRKWYNVQSCYGTCSEPRCSAESAA